MNIFATEKNHVLTLNTSNELQEGKQDQCSCCGKDHSGKCSDVDDKTGDQ